MSPKTLRTLIIGIVGVLLLHLVLRATAQPILQGVSFSRAVYDRNGHLLRLQLAGDEKYRLFTPLKQISPTLRAAFLLREDRGFYWHLGVNPWALFRASLKYAVNSDSRSPGASTITMQLIRILKGLHTRSNYGKFKQILFAIGLELCHSKDEILEAYLNLAPFGGNVEGVGAASLIAYQKEASQLSLLEALTLAIIPQSPVLHGLPAQKYGSTNYHLLAARSRLFQQWIARHPEDASRRSDFELPLIAEKIASLPYLAPHFVNEVLRRAEAGESRISTTLDLNLQQTLENKIKLYVANHQTAGIKNAAALLIDHTTMEILAWVGSANWYDSNIQGQVNGVLAKRSPGSSVKPFVYAQAFDQGLVHPETVIKDTKISYGAFDPENFDHDFKGPISVRNALIHSRNIPAFYLASLLRKPSVYELFQQSGISKLREPEFYGLSIALGGAEATMEEMVRLYATLPNHGDYQELRWQTLAGQQKILRRLFSPEAAFLVLDILKDNSRPDQNFSSDWTRDAQPIAWKTGTSHGFRDAWALGIMGHYALAVWIGNFNNESNQSFVGRDMAGPLFFSIGDALKPLIAKNLMPSESLQEPNWLSPLGLNVKKIKVCALSGHLPGESCHRMIETWFIPGKSPIKKCEVHREIELNKNGFRSCKPEEFAQLQKKIFEFWPSDLLESFHKAGIPRRQPPPFDPECQKQRMLTHGVAPVISSPRSGQIYEMRTFPGAANAIALTAVADGDVRKLSWFVGTELVGQGPPSSPIFWNSKPGHFIVRVVDDMGRSDEREMNVMASR